jgi:hypothetical protein
MRGEPAPLRVDDEDRNVGQGTGLRWRILRGDQRGGTGGLLSDDNRTEKIAYQDVGSQSPNALGIDGRTEGYQYQQAEPAQLLAGIRRLPESGAHGPKALQDRIESSVMTDQGVEDGEGSEEQNQPLQHVRPGHAAHPTQGLVGHHPDRQEQDGPGAGNGAVAHHPPHGPWP